VRNPWGSQGEWQGDWGDQSKKWDEHPHVKSALGFTGEKDDGCFYMS